MTRPEWAWKCPRVQQQHARMREHAGYDLWNAGVPCAETTAYEAENQILGELLDAAVARGEEIVTAPLEGEIRHRLSDGQVLLACVFTAPHIIDGLPVLRGAVCVEDRWYDYTTAGRTWKIEQTDWGYVQKPVPHPYGWIPISETTELQVRNTTSRSEAMRQMEEHARAYVSRFAAEQVEPRIRAAAERAAKAAAEQAALAAWMAR